MNDEVLASTGGGDPSLLDELLRTAVPEIKLALGERIDGENARPLPPRYARLLPPTALWVTLRPDAADAVGPIVHDLERELTDSCNRHGSLYDRSYTVRLQRAGAEDAPLYTVEVAAGAQEEPGIAGDDRPAVAAASGEREIGSAGTDAPGASTGTASVGSPTGWDPERWIVVVEDAMGGARETFRLTDPIVTVGRVSDDQGLQPGIAISDTPHVSRRQLALAWEARDGAPGFALYNLGLNALEVGGRKLPGARVGRGPLDLGRVPDEARGWIPPGTPFRIGDSGPMLRIDELEARDEDWIDPDATVFD